MLYHKKNKGIIRISIDPEVCHDKPVIKGTRVLVSTLLGALSGEDSKEMSDYPNIVLATSDFATSE